MSKNTKILDRESCVHCRYYVGEGYFLTDLLFGGDDMPDAALVQVVTRMTSILIALAGGVFTLVIVYGGIRFMVSHNPRSVQASKELMARAAMGLGLVLMVDVLRQLIQYVVS